MCVIFLKSYVNYISDIPENLLVIIGRRNRNFKAELQLTSSRTSYNQLSYSVQHLLQILTPKSRSFSAINTVLLTMARERKTQTNWYGKQDVQGKLVVCFSVVRREDFHERLWSTGPVDKFCWSVHVNFHWDWITLLMG